MEDYQPTSGAARRLRMRVTMTPTVLYPMIVSSLQPHADLLLSMEAERYVGIRNTLTKASLCDTESPACREDVCAANTCYARYCNVSRALKKPAKISDLCDIISKNIPMDKSYSSRLPIEISPCET
jgi:hypothetical protein